MDDDQDNQIVLVRSTNAIEKELDYKIGWVYLNRIELGQCIIGAAIGIPFFFIHPILAVVIGPLVGIPVAMTIISVWRNNKPTSYKWDTFHRLGLIGGGLRSLRRPSRIGTVFVPEARPTRAAFNGTSFGGLGRTEPCQELYGLPNWCDYGVDGSPRRRMIAHESAIGVIVIPEWEDGDGPAPEYRKECDPNEALGQTLNDFVEPRVPMRQVRRVVEWKDLA